MSVIMILVLVAMHNLANKSLINSQVKIDDMKSHDTSAVWKFSPPQN